MTNPFVINFTFWAGAACGILMTHSRYIGELLGFPFPASIVIPIVTLIIFGKAILKVCKREMMISDESYVRKKKWGRPNTPTDKR